MDRPAPSARITLGRYVPLLVLAIGLVAFTPINTNISYSHTLLMGFMISLAVAIPYYFSAHVYRDGVIGFPLRHGRRWYRTEILYIFATALVAYFVLPFYLISTGSYHNWTVQPGTSNIIRLFVGTNALGIWDELFFVTTILAILRQFLPFWYANIVQAALWTTFLYVLGFRGWGPFILYFFCLSQGYIFRRTKSLLYILTIHLTLDFILFLVLLNTHSPSWVPIFVT
ncbi:MAG TPA: CPBP family glutamic-type intramembrane protease [Patescibacteria group bacterium]|nr:CPBP family glutamic-type intramembrane protease [Patescibacteria group bacterium]